MVLLADAPESELLEDEEHAPTRAETTVSALLLEENETRESPTDTFERIVAETVSKLREMIAHSPMRMEAHAVFLLRRTSKGFKNAVYDALAETLQRHDPHPASSAYLRNILQQMMAG